MKNSLNTAYNNNPPQPSRAIIEWPEGLSNPPVVYPLGESFEESEKILTLLKNKLYEPVQAKGEAV